jgi:hypothetical protein
MQSTTSNLSTRQRLGFVISQVLVALHGLALLVKLIGSNMKQTTLEKIVIGLFLAIGTSVLLCGLYYFVKAIVGFDN